MRFVEERGIDLERLVVVFADGCSKMAGHKHGFITEFEMLLGRPVGRAANSVFWARNPRFRVFFCSQNA